MRIGSPPTAPAGTISLSPRSTVGLALEPGQSLTALVKAVGDGQVSLDLAGRLVQARTTLDLLAGQLLRLRVESDGARLLLRLTTPPTTTLLAQALRTDMPRQLPLGEVFTRLAHELKQGGDGLPAPVREAVRETLNAAIPRQSVTNPEGLRQALAEAGTFLEARLLAGNPAAGDLKGLLLRLVATLLRQGAAQPPTASAGRETDAAQAGRTPARTPAAAAAKASAAAGRLAEAGLEGLFKAAEGALARIQTHQARAALSGERGEEPAVTIEIPLRDGDKAATESLLLQVQREGGTDGEQARWRINLEFDGGDHGPVRAQVLLADGAISTTFWAEQPATTARFRDALPELLARFRAQGLSVGSVAARTGTPAEPVPLPSGLLNERA